MNVPARRLLLPGILSWLTTLALGAGCSQVVPDGAAASEDPDASAAQDVANVTYIPDIPWAKDSDAGSDSGPDLAIECPHPPLAVIDGDFSPGEWDCATPMDGKFSHVYLRLEGDQLHVLNDWFLRDDQPISANMYNQFQLSTGGGAQTWEIRVFGDDHVEVRLDGQLAPVGEGAYGFHPSPLVPKPHTIFEFRISGVLPGGFNMKNHDPAGAGGLTGKPVSPGDPIAGSQDPDAANVEEPSTFSGVMSSDGTVTPTPMTGPALIAFAQPVVGPGVEVTAVTAHMGAEPGQITVAGLAVPVLAWSDGEVVFRAPATTGTQAVVATVGGQASNTLMLKIQGILPMDCKGLQPGRWCDDSNACTAGDACDANGQCLGQFTTAGCDDGSACTIGDHCANGVCIGGGALSCNDGNPCTADSCDVSAGCQHAATAGAACSDGSVCTIGDSCTDKATCAPGATKSCEDGNTCTVDSCDATSGCTNAAVAAGTACNDADMCTTGDACLAGACKGQLLALPDAGQCWKSTCDAKNGQIGKLPLTGTVCGDGVPCTKDDTCVAGGCVGQPILCDDGNPCTVDACEPKSGSCSISIKSNGEVCDDGNLCTVQDACQAAYCKGNPLSCDDGDPKTTDSCQAGKGCVFVPK